MITILYIATRHSEIHIDSEMNNKTLIARFIMNKAPPIPEDDVLALNKCCIRLFFTE